MVIVSQATRDGFNRKNPPMADNAIQLDSGTGSRAVAMVDVPIQKGCNQPGSAALVRHDGDRDCFIDGWRGLFHLVLMADHLPFLLPSASIIFARWFEPLGYLSVAEGFVFLSGFVSGIVYTRVWRRQGSQGVWRKVGKRVLTIYACYVLAVILLVLVVKAGGPSSVEWGKWQGLLDMPLMVVVLKVATLVYEPNFLEILPMYCLFLLGVPAAIQQLEEGRLFKIAFISILIWVAAQLGIRGALTGLFSPWLVMQTGFFNSFGWQIVFVLGLLCGHKSFAAQGSWMPLNRKWVISAGILFVLFFLLRHHLVPVHVWPRLADRSSLGPLRLVDFSCAAFLVSSFRGPLRKFVDWPGLAFLSRHSLQVFSFHLFPIYLVALALAVTTTLPAVGQCLVMLFCLASLFVIALLAGTSRYFQVGAFRPVAKGPDL